MLIAFSPNVEEVINFLSMKQYPLIVENGRFADGNIGYGCCDRM